MAKGNMFLGMARGSVGDVVFYYQNGEQCSRKRNRSPKNPKSPAQLIQRAITATIGRAYQTGKAIFDHSFEGKVVAEGNARRFRSVNSHLLRERLAADIAQTPAGRVSALVVGPGTVSPVPNAYMLSEGTLQQGFFTITEPTEQSTSAMLVVPDASSASETLAQYMQRWNLSPGDIYTMAGFTESTGDEVVFNVVAAGGEVGGLQLLGQFFFVRLMVKEPDTPSKLVSEADFSDIFSMIGSENVSDFHIADEALAGSRRVQTLFGFRGSQEVACIGVIRSELNSGLRSTTYATWARYDNRAGLDYHWAIAGWQQGSPQIGDSDLILEGGDSF